MECNTSGFPILHHLPELAQTHVCWVGDATQPSCPLLSPGKPTANFTKSSSDWVTPPTENVHWLPINNSYRIEIQGLGQTPCKLSQECLCLSLVRCVPRGMGWGPRRDWRRGPRRGVPALEPGSPQPTGALGCAQPHRGSGVCTAPQSCLLTGWAVVSHSLGSLPAAGFPGEICNLTGTPDEVALPTEGNSLEKWAHTHSSRRKQTLARRRGLDGTSTASWVALRPSGSALLSSAAPSSPCSLQARHARAHWQCRPQRMSPHSGFPFPLCPPPKLHLILYNQVQLLPSQQSPLWSLERIRHLFSVSRPSV